MFLNHLSKNKICFFLLGEEGEENIIFVNKICVFHETLTSRLSEMNFNGKLKRNKNIK